MKRSLVFLLLLSSFTFAQSINRRAVVRRHNPVLHAADPNSPLSVGNGSFAFTADVTGLQTFYNHYLRNGTPIETQASWLWHSYPNPNGYKLEDTYRTYDTHGRSIGYPTDQNSAAGDWLRKNPHRYPPGQIGFVLTGKNGSPVQISDLKNIAQKLDLWTGALTSRYSVHSIPVEVNTVCHPRREMVAVRIKSDLLGRGRMAIALAFPANHDMATKLTPALDWSHPEGHRTEIIRNGDGRVELRRTIDQTRYAVTLVWSGNARFAQVSAHRFELRPSAGATSFEFVVQVGDAATDNLPSVAQTLRESAGFWEEFWQNGGIVDFSGSSDRRALELERRIVLSQYLLRIQNAGSQPPQESGLTVNTWYGKFHTEMIWWNTAHFALWNHPELAERPLQWYQSVLPQARQLARERGLTGARWAKMVGPEGRESPGGNPLIAWNQPHPIYLAELVYRTHPDRNTLERYRDVVFESAECLATLASWDGSRRQYVLGPPLWISQEIYDQATSQNPAFELSYWAFALKVAQQWRERLGMPRDPEWDRVIHHLSPLPVANGLYTALESTPDTFTNAASRQDHPTMLAPFGLLPGDLVDPEVMRRTLAAVLQAWDFEAKIWGWDYPLIAMTATRLGEPETAIDILLRNGPNNGYAANGHVRLNNGAATYLPANGALLSAVALMTAGWDGNKEPLPGFPKNGKWKVRYENIRPLP